MHQAAVPYLRLVTSGWRAMALLKRLRVMMMMRDGGGGSSGQGRVNDGLRCTQWDGGRNMWWKWGKRNYLCESAYTL